MKILIVDEHLMFRQGLAALLSRELAEVELRHAGTATEARRRLGWAERVTLGLSLPDQHGLRFLREIRPDYPELPVIVLTAFDEKAFRRRAAELGAAAFICKRQPFAEVLAALLHPQGCGEAADWSGLEPLSEAEREVLLLLGQGLANSEVAERLGIRLKTVYSYRRQLLLKLALPGASCLLRYAALYYSSLN